jgi:hypothetical protein
MRAEGKKAKKESLERLGGLSAPRPQLVPKK